MKRVLFGMAVVSALVPAIAAANEVNLYSGRKTELIEPLLEKFTAETGIEVNLVTGSSDALLQRLQAEGNLSPADVFITVDAARLQNAKDAGVLQSFNSAEINRVVPSNLRDAEGQWVALSQRARVIFYREGAVEPSELSTYEALADDKWNGRVCIRSSSNVYNQSMVASMISANGEAATEQWANDFMDSFARPPAGGDTDQLRALAAGVCDVAVANTYYYGRMLKSDGADLESANKINFIWPNQGDRGTHVNVSGAGITKSAKNKDNAIALLEYLVSPAAQSWYAQVNSEFPVVQSAPKGEVVGSWGEFEADNVPLNTLGVLNKTAVQVMDRAGWK